MEYLRSHIKFNFNGEYEEEFLLIFLALLSYYEKYNQIFEERFGNLDVLEYTIESLEQFAMDFLSFGSADDVSSPSFFKNKKFDEKFYRMNSNEDENKEKFNEYNGNYDGDNYDNSFKNGIQRYKENNIKSKKYF